MILKMAFRNIFRQKKRTILTLITITFGIFVGVIGDGLNSGLKWQLADTYIKTSTSTLKLYKKDFYNPEEIRSQVEYGFKDSQQLSDLIKNIPEKLGSSKRYVFDGKITNGVEELNAKYIGVTVNDEELLFERSKSIISGKFIADNDENKIVIGKDLADALELKKGDIVTISARSKKRTLNAYDVEIKGIIRTGNPLVDMSSVFIPLSFSQKLADSNEINDITVLLKNKEMVNIKKSIAVMSKDAEALGLEIVPWYEEIKDLLGLVAFREKVFSVITTVILIMAAAGIMNTMLMAMLERKVEIGIMMANGMKTRDILILFISEGGILGIIGSGIAIIIGYVIVSYFQMKGIPIPVSKEQLGAEFPIVDRLYTHFDYEKALLMFCIGVAVSIIATFYPAEKAVKLEPVEAIRK